MAVVVIDASIGSMKMAKKKVWHPLDLAALPNCRIIACDPSLTALGMVFLEVHESQAVILGAEKLSTARTDKVGWEDTFERAKTMEGLVAAVMTDWLEDFGSGNLMAFVESPPIGGGPLVRVESTLLTGYGFTKQALEQDIAVGPLVMPQAHKWLLCGNYRAVKKEHHEELKKLLPDILDGKLITNEALRDALSIALFGAHKMGSRHGSRSTD
jgi:hypothetical protein